MTDVYQGITSKEGFAVHFCNGVHVFLGSDLGYDVMLYNENGELKSAIANARGSAVFPFRWLERWRVVVERNGIEVYEHEFNPRGRRVLISLGSSSMGDTIAWVPYLDAFRERWGCHVVGCTFHNDWVRGGYPDIEWVEPGTGVNDLYAITTVGWCYHPMYTGMPQRLNSPKDFRREPLQWTAARQLGVPPVERRPAVSIAVGERRVAEPYVCLGIHSTAQAKYWNNPTGWDEVTGWLISRGYRVIIASREGDGYMGNRHPEGAETLDRYAIEDTATLIKYAECFVGVGSGLSWLAWALETPVVLISGFSDPWTEIAEAKRIKAPAGVCTGCFNRRRLAAEQWDWCPDRSGPEKFECSKAITAEVVIEAVEEVLDQSRREAI